MKARPSKLKKPNSSSVAVKNGDGGSCCCCCCCCCTMADGKDMLLLLLLLLGAGDGGIRGKEPFVFILKKKVKPISDVVTVDLIPLIVLNFVIWRSYALYFWRCFYSVTVASANLYIPLRSTEKRDIFMPFAANNNYNVTCP